MKNSEMEGENTFNWMAKSANNGIELTKTENGQLP